MRYIELGQTGERVSDVALGVMRVGNKTPKEAQAIIEKAYEKGVNFYDTADIYESGRSSVVLGQALKDAGIARDKIYLQSKGGIILKDGQIDGDGWRGPRFDFAKEHLVATVDAELKRLQTDYLDTFLLHRPDTLMELDDIAEAFVELKNASKVKYFGVSNMNPWQVELVQSALDDKLVTNQLQFGIMHTGMIDADLHVNMKDEASINRDGGILAYSRLKQMTIQAWSPFQYGYFEGVFIDNPQFEAVNHTLQILADKYQVTKNAVATAFITRHPANMQVVIGSMNLKRIDEMTDADKVTLTKQEWYDIYQDAGGILP